MPGLLPGPSREAQVSAAAIWPGQTEWAGIDGVHATARGANAASAYAALAWDTGKDAGDHGAGSEEAADVGSRGCEEGNR